jgi:trk system potassium uptake protein TrkH
MPKLNYVLITHIMGFLLIANGGFMFVAAAVSWIYNDGATYDLIYAAGTTLIIGFALMIATRSHRKKLTQRDGYLVVTLGWILLVCSGMLPYIYTGSIADFSSAFFETMSGYTTTGATILNDIERLPEGILLWRSFTHWIGGMGIIVLAVAIIPLLGIGGMQLFSAESPGPSADKLKPRIADTAKRLWLIYVGYTFSETILLKAAGMSLFDAFNHSLSTLSTGGFSTKNANVAYWNDQPIIQYIIILFMILAGTNFVLSYYGVKGKLSRVFGDTEFKWYLFFIGVFTTISALIIYFKADLGISTIDHPQVWGEAEGAFRHALFQVASVITTTGFVTSDFNLWTPLLTILFFGIFFLGGSAGSTAGGIKVVRQVILIRNGITEFKRALHPNAILPLRFNGQLVKENVIFKILGFFILYMLSFIIGSIGFAAMGFDFPTALGGAASSLGNIGPAFGSLSPVDNFSILPDIGKWWSAFLMLIGRLELFTVLIILTPFFWSNR